MGKNRGQKEPTLEQKVLDYISKHGLLLNEPLVVAVSGGGDSVCLLHLLFKLKEKLGLRLYIAHLNHMLRGTESRDDACYVSDLAKSLDIPVTIEKRDAKAYQAEKSISLEEAAREVRYTFLARVAKSIGTGQVAVGHTFDDHIETILMHLVRGTGTRGLRGLRPSSQMKFPDMSITIIRPRLEVSREETATYCQRHQLKPRLDSSNLSLSPLRNRIRLELLPLLENYNPQVSQALARTAGIASDDLAFLDEESARMWGKIAEIKESVITLDKNEFSKLAPSLQRQLLRISIEKLLGNLKDVEARHIEEILASLKKQAGKKISLPRGLVFVVEYDRYLISSDPKAMSPFPALETEFELKIPGKTELPGWQVKATILSQSEEKGNKFTAYFDSGKTGDKLIVRSRKPGDRFQPLGLNQPKKLSEFMVDAKIPQAWRGQIPLVCSKEHIIWVVGWRIDERVKVSKDTRKVLHLKFKQS